MHTARRVTLRTAIAGCALLLVAAGCSSSTTSNADRAQTIDIVEPTLPAEIPTAAVESTSPAAAASDDPGADDTGADDSDARADGAGDDDAGADDPVDNGEGAEPTTAPGDAADTAPVATTAPAATATPAPAAPAPTATVAPTPTAEPAVAPPPTATATPPPPPPTATPTPTPEPSRQNARATPDGDSAQSPQIVTFRASPTSSTTQVTLDGDISFGSDDADYYRFVAEDGFRLTGIQWSVSCRQSEYGDTATLLGRGSEIQGFAASGTCSAPAAGFGNGADDLNGTYDLAVSIAARPGQTLDASAYDPVNGFAPYGAYEIAVTGTLVAHFSYTTAPLDGDSADNPRSDRFPISGDSVSAPEGDNEDWFKFDGAGLVRAAGTAFPSNGQVLLELQCQNQMFDAGSGLSARLFDENNNRLAGFTCNSGQSKDSQLVPLTENTSYFLQVTIKGTGSSDWTWGVGFE